VLQGEKKRKRESENEKKDKPHRGGKIAGGQGGKVGTHKRKGKEVFIQVNSQETKRSKKRIKKRRGRGGSRGRVGILKKEELIPQRRSGQRKGKRVRISVGTLVKGYKAARGPRWTG